MSIYWRKKRLAHLLTRRKIFGTIRPANLKLGSYSKASGDEPRHFEPWSSDEDDIWTGILSSNFPTTQTEGPLSSQ
ncbi:hypothetical protein TNCV_186001 [Trichonephila clavipes]|nr:hypothetical protein TNCV_186001 [Trichonephila clavipes]